MGAAPVLASILGTEHMFARERVRGAHGRADTRAPRPTRLLTQRMQAVPQRAILGPACGIITDDAVVAHRLK